MYRQVGNSALLLLLITSAISHIAGPARNSAASLAMHASSSSASASAVPVSAVDADKQKCQIFEVLRLYTGYAESHAVPDTTENNGGAPSAPANCTTAGFAGIFPSGIPRLDAKRSQILLATLPDPLESSEALQFDRDIAALQEAASTAGYDFIRIALPWRLSDLGDPKDLKASRDVEQYRQAFGDEPGAMLFRKRIRSKSPRLQDPDELLLLVLVPESPIYGLNLAGAREALSAVRVLSQKGFRTTAPEERSNDTLVRWIGPNYSASAFGLRAIEQESQPHLSFDVLSGTITTSTANALVSQLNKDSKHETRNTTLSELDLTALCGFLGQETPVGSRYYDPVVILQEDETTYGNTTSEAQGQDTTCGLSQVRRFSFPRGISHVRSIYGNTLKNTSADPSQSSDSSSGADLNLSFRDDLEEPLDSVPEFAPQSPVSNESSLAAIAESISHLNARAIVIRTSDPLDQLFLARYFRKACPDSRLVLFNAERLLTRLRGDFNLDGTLIVTRFPLFQNAYLQTPYRGESRHSLTFTNSREEAIFLAALIQIADGRLPILQAPYRNQRYELAPWIGVASGGDFWPVAYLGEHPVKPVHTESENALLLTDTPPERLPVLWALVTLAVLTMSIVHFIFFLIALPLNEILRNSKQEWVRRMAVHRVLTYYLFPPNPSDEQLRLITGQYWWLLNATTQLMLMLVYLLFPAIAYQLKITDIVHFPTQTLILAAFASIALIFLLAMSGALLALLARQCSQQEQNFFSRVENRLLPFVSALWVLISVTLFCLQLADSHRGFAFASRSLHLSSGVCPILPLLLFALGFLVASVVNLNALSMALTRNTGVPKLDWFFLDLKAWQKKLGGYTELWYGLPGADGNILAAAILLACLLLHPQRLFATFDSVFMAWLYTLNFVFSIWTVLWLWVRFLRTWSVLRSGLDCLEGSPLRFAFSRLPAIFSADPIWSYVGLRRVVVLPMRWLEYFRVTPAVVPDKPALFKNNQDELARIVEQMRVGEWLDNLTYPSFSQQQNDYAITLSNDLGIRATWDRGGPDCKLQAASPAKDAETDEAAPSSSCPQSRPDVPSPCDTEPDAYNCRVEIGNEFIAMRIAAYIRYITLHMKNLMTFMSLGFLLTLLGVVSYTFDRPQVIAWSATLLLAALLFTVGTVLAQMDRDPILSRMSNSTPGRVRYAALIKHLIAIGGLPFITVLATLFPAIGSSLFSWLGPLFETLH
jgi:hypothetical protein